MAAENGLGVRAAGPEIPASMRPRRMAAENTGVLRGAGRGGRRFNEAAAHGRGKPGLRRFVPTTIRTLQ